MDDSADGKYNDGAAKGASCTATGRTAEETESFVGHDEAGADLIPHGARRAGGCGVAP